MEPALAALSLRAAVPSDTERLIAPSGKGDQVLLQRIDPEGVDDLVIAERPIVVLRADHELGPRARESGDHTELLEPSIGEVSQHRGCRRLLHGERVVRAPPALRLGGVAARAD